MRRGSRSRSVRSCVWPTRTCRCSRECTVHGSKSKVGTGVPGEGGLRMDQPQPGRRDFLRVMTALGAAGLPVAAFESRLSAVARVPEAPAYDPAGRFAITATDVEFRRNRAGRQLMARVYQPAGAGPFPTVLDLHGGAWNTKDRHAEEPMDRALAESGLLVVAIDMTLAPEAPYPASVQDANYGVRWLKWKARGWNGDPSAIGVYASSSGGHVAELLAMR